MVFRVNFNIEWGMEKNINKYKLKVNYSSKLDKFVEKLDDNIKKDIDNGSNTYR
tara:strand:- start:481 stop:642 length:162 start_codon:yes stop_codon:yes gene_type:complete